MLIAVTLHLAVLAAPPVRHAGATPPPGPLRVQLVEARPAAPEPLPVAAPEPAPAKTAVERPVRQKKQRILTAPAEQAATTATTPVVAAAPDEAPPAAPEPAAVTAPPAAAPAVVAARFDAAYLNNPKPAYPPLSNRLGEEGTVKLRVRVSADGRAVSVDLEASSGFPRLDKAARQAVANWRFVPARRGDEAIEASVIVPMVFRLGG